MASLIKIKRRVGGAQAAPTGTNNEGELALFFPGVAGDNDKPTLFANDGSGWRTVNPHVAVATQSIDLNTPGGGNVGSAAAAWVAANAAFTGDITIGTFGVPAQAYVLTNPAAVGNASSWTSLGGAVSFASAADIKAGVDTTKAINSAILRGETLAVPSAAGGIASNVDVDKLVRLGATGLIDDAFLSVKPLTYKGNVDLTAAYTAPGVAWSVGDFGTASGTGTVAATWPGFTGGETVKAADLVIWDGTNYHLIANEASLAAYLPLAGGTMAPGDTTSVVFAPATKDGSVVVVDAGGGQVKDAFIDCGTYT